VRTECSIQNAEGNCVLCQRDLATILLFPCYYFQKQPSTIIDLIYSLRLANEKAIGKTFQMCARFIKMCRRDTQEKTASDVDILGLEAIVHE